LHTAIWLVVLSGQASIVFVVVERKPLSTSVVLQNLSLTSI